MSSRMFWMIVGVWAAMAPLMGNARASAVPAPVVTGYRVSSVDPSMGDGPLAWCAAESPPPSGRFTDGGESFDDWWEAELQPGRDTVGSLLMRSGTIQDGHARGHRIRDFAWFYQLRGETAWHRVPGADLYANRAQLIFRFPAISGVARLRLAVRPRSAEELQLAGSNAPCLREARFFADTDAAIPVDPWFFAVATWEEGNPYLPLLHWGEPYDPYPGVQEALAELIGRSTPDSTDELWIGDWGDWVMHEPAPAGFLLSGNYKDYDTVDPAVYAGFYRFVHQTQGAVPMLGACGGHQLLAMAMAYPDFDGFASEFAPDDLNQVDVTCSTVPQYACGGEGPVQCCQEATDPFRWLSSNNPGAAMPNLYQSRRIDLLFNLLGDRNGGKAIRGWLHHTDFVNPARIAGDFDVIATYPREVPAPSRDNPSLVQAMRLRRGVMYGTQFHWDEEHIGRCGREDWERDMERVLKNFTLIALSRTAPGRELTATVTSGADSVARLFDLDRASMWCAGGAAADIVLRFPKPAVFGSVLMVEGDTPEQAKAQAYRFEVSDDGRAWRAVPAERSSLYERQHRRVLSCDPEGEPLPGVEDGQSTITRLSGAAGTYLRIHVTSSSGRPACLRELHVYDLTDSGGSTR